MTNPVYQQVTIDGKEIHRIVFDRILPACDGEKLGPTVMSLLASAVIMLSPDIELEKLQDVIMGASEYLVIATAEVPAGEAN